MALRPGDAAAGGNCRRRVIRRAAWPAARAALAGAAALAGSAALGSALGLAASAASAARPALGRGRRLAGAGQADGEEAGEVFYLGSAVPNRNIPPPTSGCTALGKTWQPLSAAPFASRTSWDWCQQSCATEKVTSIDGSIAPCEHFAFFPDGRCYLQGAGAVLKESLECSQAHPCEHGFAVVSGPADCNNTAMWAVPPVGATTAPATEGGADNAGAIAGAAVGAAAAGAAVGAGAAAGAAATPAPLPKGVIKGFYYSPRDMPGTLRVLSANWEACMNLCASNLACKHFGFWPDGGCHQQGNNATLTKATCSEEESVNCTQLGVVSGPRDLSDESLWAPPMEWVDSRTTGIKPKPLAGASREVDVEAPKETPVQHGGFPLVWIGVLAAILLVVYGFSRGWFGGSDDEDDSDRETQEFDEDDSADLSVPLKQQFAS